MKAKIIQQKLSANINDYVHGGGRPTKRLVFEQAGGLVVTVADGQIYAFTGFDLVKEKYTDLGQVDVPQSLVDAALRYTKARSDFEKTLNSYEKLLK
jgi:hypothetical protein